MELLTRDQAQELLKKLREHYPHAKMILEWETNFELLVAVMLSAQCTDVLVNKVTKVVFHKYRASLLKLRTNYAAETKNLRIKPAESVELLNFAYVKIEELEQDIHSVNFYHNKAKNVQAAAMTLINNFQGVIPKTIEELTSLPGVGRKTANVVLGNAYGIYEGIAVDTHVKKQSQLLGLTTNADPDKIEQDLMKLFDRKDWFSVTYLLIEHGRNVRKKPSDRIYCSTPQTCVLCGK